MEEGAPQNKTQKIPVSLIKQQEKIPVPASAVPFYNPRVSGPKLNNYVTQAAAFQKKPQHSSTANLVNKAVHNYSAVAANTVNSSLNQPSINVHSVSNILQAGLEPNQSLPSSRSNKNISRFGSKAVKIDLSQISDSSRPR